MNTLQQKELFLKNRLIIKGMSIRISRNTGVDAQEIESEANLVFCECCNKYKEEIGEFSKFLTNSLYFKLYKFCKRRGRHLNELHEETEGLIDFFIQKEYDLIDVTLENLSRDGRQAVEIVFNLCPEYMEKRRKITKGRIKRELQSRGWSERRIERAFYEISMALTA